jgi:hypothetical protein
MVFSFSRLIFHFECWTRLTNLEYPSVSLGSQGSQGCDRSIPNSTVGCETLDSQAARRFRLINDFRLARGPLWWNGGCAQPPSFLS